MVEVIGWIASLLFALCGVPQAIACYRQGHAEGISKLFMWTWFVAEILMQDKVLSNHGWDMPLLVNYWFNTIVVGIILKYVYFPKPKNTSN